MANDDGVRGDVAKALAGGAKQTRNAADEIKKRQHIDEPQQIAGNNLVELEPEALGVHDAQAEYPFADGLAAKTPFTENAVADADNEVSQSVKSGGKVRAENRKKKGELAQDG